MAWNPSTRSQDPRAESMANDISQGDSKPRRGCRDSSRTRRARESGNGGRCPGKTVNAEEALGTLCNDNQYPITDLKILL